MRTWKKRENTPNMEMVELFLRLHMRENQNREKRENEWVQKCKNLFFLKNCFTCLCKCIEIFSIHIISTDSTDAIVLITTIRFISHYLWDNCIRNLTIRWNEMMESNSIQMKWNEMKWFMYSCVWMNVRLPGECFAYCSLGNYVGSCYPTSFKYIIYALKIYGIKK